MWTLLFLIFSLRLSIDGKDIPLPGWERVWERVGEEIIWRGR